MDQSGTTLQASSTRRDTGDQSSSFLGSSLATGAADLSQRSASLRPRKSNAPDIGTPIKVASSSPYRTPESSSKASFFLSKTPFGTPSKLGETSSASISKPSSSLQTSTTPVKASTGFWPESWALARSTVDDDAYCTFALQPRPHLSYAGLVSMGIRASFVKLAIVAIIAHQCAFAFSLFRPTNPLQIITLPLRPVFVLLSFASISLLALFVLIIPGQPFSLTKKQWANQQRQQGFVKEERFAGFSFSAGSPMNLIVRTIRSNGVWRGVLLHTLVAMALVVPHTLALSHYGSNEASVGPQGSWRPYVQVPIRLAQGYKTTVLRPNERFWFLLCSNAILGASYAFFRTITAIHRTNGSVAPFSAPRFDAQAPLESAASRLSQRLRRSAPVAALFGILTSATLLPIYSLVRRPFFRLLLSVIGRHSPLRQVVIPSLKRPLFSLDLVFRSSLLGLATVVLLEIVNVAWEVFATQSIGVKSGGLSKYSREPTPCLIRGMQLRRTAMPGEGHLGAADRDYYAHFAYAEMASIVATNSERRKAIFRDVGNTLSSALAEDLQIPSDQRGRSAWALVARECLHVLREERRCVEARGKESLSLGSGTNANASAAQSRLKPVDAAHRVPLEAGTGVKAHAPSIWDRLASTSLTANRDAATKKPVTPQATAATVSGASEAEGLSSILHRIAPSAAAQSSVPIGPSAIQSTSATTAALASDQKQTISVLELVLHLVIEAGKPLVWLFNFLPSDLQHVLVNSYVARTFVKTRATLFRPSNEALLLAGVVPHDEALATWSAQILGALLSASLEEDEYGSVALAGNVGLGADDVLDELSLLLLALQRWAVDCTQEVHDQPGAKVHVARHLDAYVEPLIHSLRNSSSVILSAFKMTDYHFRHSTLRNVEEALQYSAPKV